MPEGDTIHRAAHVLRTALVGQELSACQLPRVASPLPRKGTIVESVDARGKHLEITFEDGVVLHTHLRMSGSWHVYRPGERWRKSSKHVRAVLETKEWVAVCFSAPVVETRRVGDSAGPVLEALGPDLCVPPVDLAACLERFARFSAHEQLVCEALLDQRIACGVGNVYKSETLWACEVSPFATVGDVAPALREQLLDTASTLLQANLGGPARVTVPGVGLAVYGRAGKPCLRCRGPVASERRGVLARVTFWCPRCQVQPTSPKGSEGADGHDAGGADGDEQRAEGVS